MQFKSLLFASVLALGAAANNASDIAPTVQRRIAQLDLGFKQTDVLLNQLKHNTGGVTANVRYSRYSARSQSPISLGIK